MWRNLLELDGILRTRYIDRLQMHSVAGCNNLEQGFAEPFRAYFGGPIALALCWLSLFSSGSTTYKLSSREDGNQF